MRNLILRFTLCLALLMFACVGCEFMTGAGAGAAGSETIQSWKVNLEAKKAELQARYDAVLAEIESAPDPNALARAKQKAEQIEKAQVGNQAALMVVQAALDYPRDGPADDRKDFYASLVVGLGAFAYEVLTKRKLNTKYVSMKEGQATFQAAEPDAGQKLYTAIGIARTKRGL